MEFPAMECRLCGKSDPDCCTTANIPESESLPQIDMGDLLHAECAKSLGIPANLVWYPRCKAHKVSAGPA